MTVILTVAELRTHLETGLADAALQRILDSETAEIERHVPAAGARSDMYRGGGATISLRTPAASVSSVVETTGLDSVTLAADDYYVLNGGRTLQRREDGSNPPVAVLLPSRVGPQWAPLVTVSYTTSAATAASSQKVVALINLCKLAVRYSGLRNEAVSGDYSETTLDYQAERAAILRSLDGGSGAVFA